MLLSYVRTVVLYLVLILAIRMMGKRQIGQMEASEFVVTMLVANLASIPMQDSGIPLLSGLVPILTVLGMELVLSGAIGNIIDRLFRGYVVDFFEFTFFEWPVFNVADIYVVVGVILLALMLIFVVKEEDLDFKKKKDE